jgi:hypothetical protein
MIKTIGNGAQGVIATHNHLFRQEKAYPYLIQRKDVNIRHVLR